MRRVATFGVGRRALPAGWVVVAALACGCSREPSADVSGVVTLNGKPPNTPGMTINFLGPAGRPVSAPVGPDGSYATTGVAVGATVVGIAVIDKAADAAQLARDQAGPGGSPVPKGKAPADDPPAGAKKSDLRDAVPARYRDPRQSGLALTTRPGPNTFDVDLK